jgi:hypothetical protein
LTRIYARDARVIRLGEAMSRALGIDPDRLAPHDPQIDEHPEVLKLEAAARRHMKTFDALAPYKRRASTQRKRPN